MLYLLLFLAAVLVSFIGMTRRHFSQIVPPYRVEQRCGILQVRRYPKVAVAEIRVSGSASASMRQATAALNRYFRENRIARFAMPLLAEKVDAADSIWAVSAVLPMPLAAAPAPRNTSLQLKELPPHRVFARLHHGPTAPDDMLARTQAEMLPLVNNACRDLGCTKLSTVVVMHRFPWWMPDLFRVSDLMVRITDDTERGG